MRLSASRWNRPTWLPDFARAAGATIIESERPGCVREIRDTER